MYLFIFIDTSHAYELKLKHEIMYTTLCVCYWALTSKPFWHHRLDFAACRAYDLLWAYLSMLLSPDIWVHTADVLVERFVNTQNVLKIHSGIGPRCTGRVWFARCLCIISWIVAVFAGSCIVSCSCEYISNRSLNQDTVPPALPVSEQNSTQLRDWLAVNICSVLRGHIPLFALSIMILWTY